MNVAVVIAALLATSGQKTGTAAPVNPYDLMFSVVGALGGGEMVGKVVMTRRMVVDCPNSRASAGTAPSATTVLTIKRNGSGVGTITYATDGTASWSCSPSLILSAGDVLAIYNQGTADPALADVSVTVKGTM